MKTREQLIEEIEIVRVDFATKPFPTCSTKIIDLVVEVCEGVVASTYSKDYSVNKILENLKKLKSR